MGAAGIPCPLDRIIHICSMHSASVYLSSSISECHIIVSTLVGGARSKGPYLRIGKLRLEKRNSTLKEDPNLDSHSKALYYIQLSQLGVTFHQHTLLSV